MKFINPPGATPGRKPLHITAAMEAELRAHPNQWALVKEGVNRTTYSAVAQWARRRGDIECTTRMSRDSFDVYLRFVTE